MSKSYERVGETTKKDGQSTTIFSILTERKASIQILLYSTREEEMTSNDLLSAQADVEIYFRRFYRQIHQQPRSEIYDLTLG